MSSSNDKVLLSVVVMTYNEEANIERCLKSIYDWASEIFVVDSFSTDRTIEITKRYTDKIFSHKYEGHPQQWQWALDTLSFSNEWIFAVDADFQVTPELWHAIRNELSQNHLKKDGYYVRHRQLFKSKFIRCGGIYPSYWLRIFRHHKVFIDPNDLVDLNLYINGTVGKLEYDVIEDNQKDREMSFWVEKQVRFAKKQAQEELRRRNGSSKLPITPRFFGILAEHKLWLKEKWYTLPLYIRPFLLFFYRYFLLFGFLDGKEGFLYHFSQSFLYRLLVDVRIEELQGKLVLKSNGNEVNTINCDKVKKEE